MTEPETPDPGRGPDAPEASPAVERRTFFERVSSVAMGAGLVSSYGLLAWLAGRYLYPARKPREIWLFVTTVDRLRPGEALSWRTPAGEDVTIARLEDAEGDLRWLALSSTCPHLGCKVHWEPLNNRFFCPCHNGVFTPQGEPVSGPPAEAGQSLPRYGLRVEGGLVFLQVPDPSAGLVLRDARKRSGSRLAARASRRRTKGAV